MGKDAPVHVSAVLRKGSAETVALVMFRFTVPPVLVMVNVLELNVPMVTSPKANVDGVMLPVTVGPVTPVPVMDEILLVPSVAFVTTVSVPKEMVTAVGK